MKICFVSTVLFFLLYSCGGGKKNNSPNDSDVNNTETVISVMDTTNSETVSVKTDSIYSFCEYKNDHCYYGFKNREGKVIIEPKFDLAANFIGEFAPVVLGNVHGFCDTTGKIVTKIKQQFEISYNELSGESSIGGIGEGLIAVMDVNENYGFVNTKGELVINCDYVDVESFSDGLALVIVNGKAGFIDTTGKMVIQPLYENANSFREGLASVLVNGKYGFINKKGEMVIQPKYKEAWFFKEGLCAVSLTDDYSNYFFIDTTGKTIIKGPFEQAGNFQNGVCTVMKNGRCIEIDKTGKKLRDVGTDCFAGC